ncbi:Hypothetical predicted protein [Olea europaea subsp. europaea]|uniref:Transmembrane protein n=1 Tax=Olea europaea subsp. europaea TaxID=158383 RepID=A0A8S0TD69_OLEEU|nr:Hypothetical predicted protein [Olea europaea subsp. europaea]
MPHRRQCSMAPTPKTSGLLFILCGFEVVAVKGLRFFYWVVVVVWYGEDGDGDRGPLFSLVMVVGLLLEIGSGGGDFVGGDVVVVVVAMMG